MITRDFFKARTKVTRTKTRPYPASGLFMEFYWCLDSDHAAVFFSDQEECIGEFSRAVIIERGWL